VHLAGRSSHIFQTILHRTLILSDKYNLSHPVTIAPNVWDSWLGGLGQYETQAEGK